MNLGPPLPGAEAECVQVTTTVATRDEADRIAAAVVVEGLAACAQVQGPINSTFRWEGRVDVASEWYCHLKTTRRRLPELMTRLEALHSYQTPEIIALPILDGHPGYLRWVSDSVRPGS